ncbi:hypothetical protein B9T35_15320 [Acinetobacter sp. ANC 3832]|nr:hypothetical protein B9T35_15320 [Acinetobacter sp. ANC 3832]
MLNCLEFPHPQLNALLEQGVLTLSIQRPEARNALNAELQARHIAALPSAALKTIKSQMKHHLEHVIECIDHEAKIVAQRIKSPEMLEAVMAFLQKRAPDFT